MLLTAAAASAQTAPAPPALSSVAPAVSQAVQAQPATQAVTQAAASAAGSATKTAAQSASTARKAVASVPAAVPTVVSVPPVPVPPPAAPIVDALPAPAPIEVPPAVTAVEPLVVAPEVVDDVVNQVAGVSAATDEMVADEIAATEALAQDVQGEAQATPAVLPAHVVAASAQAIEASTNHAGDVVAPDVADDVDNAVATIAPSPVDVPSPQALPVHDSWAIQPSAAPVVSEVVSSAPMAQLSTLESLGGPSDQETAALSISISVEPLTWAGVGRSTGSWTADTQNTPLRDDSLDSSPIVPDTEQPFRAVPAGMGLSTSAVAGWMAPFSALAGTSAWRPWMQTASSGRAFIVLPNLSPPG